MKKLSSVLLLTFLLCSFKEKELVWVAIGDSITYLNNHPDETGNRVVKGYLTRVMKMLPNLRYINQGHNCWTSGGISGEIERIGLIKADVYSVFLGTNDWWQGHPVGKFEDSVFAASPETEFILIAPMPNPSAIQSGLQEQYKIVLAKLIRKRVVLANLTGVYAELLKRKSYQDLTGNNVNHLMTTSRAGMPR